MRISDWSSDVCSSDLLRELAAGGVAIGVHGKTHTPMPHAEDLDAELATARRIVGDYLGTEAPTTMSYPHGRYDETVLARTRDAGYELAFTSNPVMNAMDDKPSWLRGRPGCAHSRRSKRLHSSH